VGDPDRRPTVDRSLRLLQTRRRRRCPEAGRATPDDRRRRMVHAEGPEARTASEEARTSRQTRAPGQDPTTPAELSGRPRVSSRETTRAPRAPRSPAAADTRPSA
jgi:hypothetical protein